MALDTTEIGLIGSGGGLVVLFGISVFIMWYNNQNHSDKILSNSKILEANKARSTNSHESLKDTDLNSIISSIDNAFGRNATKRRKKQRKNKSNKRNKRNKRN